MSDFPSIIYLRETDSTNSYFGLSKQRHEEGTTVYAGFQSAGRGQQGNVWESELDANLLFSMVLYPQAIKVNEQFIISQTVSVAILNFLSKYTDNIRIKWPNDIYWKDRKICGILIENSIAENNIGQSVIGIGININQTVFASDAPNPVSLKNITGDTYSIDILIKEVRDLILEQYERLKKGNTDSIRQEYKKKLYRTDGFYRYNDGVSDFEAVIADVENDGILCLITKGGDVRRFFFKEVKYL